MLIHEELKIYRVRLPLPFELNHINCYAIKGNTGWSVVDCGLDHKPCNLGWQEFMENNSIEAKDISGIYITHLHPDHSGLAAWLQKLSGAPVYLSAPEAEAQDRFRYATRTGQFSELLLKNGIPPALLPKMESFMNPGRIPEQELPRHTVIEHGDKVLLGDFKYKVLVTPGHSDGHICFYNEKFSVLFSGDTILSDISPNIGLWSWTTPNPLKDYLESLDLCRELYCKLVLPAHGEPFTNLEHRISEMKEIHSNKLDLIKSLVAEETTVYSIVLDIYGKTLDMLNLGLAMGEVYAHLMFLCYKGELQTFEKEGKYFFSLQVFE